MKQNIVIVGAGGFGREVQWLIERINENEDTWNILGYIDDGVACGTLVDGIKVLGDIEYLLELQDKLAVVCAVGASRTREKIIHRLSQCKNIVFPNLIDPSVICSKRMKLGIGNIICAGNILTVDITFEDFNIVNLDCTIGHDVTIKSYVTLYPSVNISGCVEIGEKTEIGTGSHVIQGIKIGCNSILGAGSVVIRDVPSDSTVVGNPAKKIK